ncbi:MAG: orotidine-5'-phosphate decarboxylase [Phycisphaeraceae bacterium]|nr:MAG: orotidine-5'-phosphate decarboxylase [Phycisphaeraceae bacterium]
MTVNAALEKLKSAWRRTGSLISVGLEPADRYLPKGFRHTVEDHERFLRLVIEAAAPCVPAFKFNMAHFEAFGSSGWAMLERVRASIPNDCFVIMDGKRGDIGTSSEHYARSVYEHLNADAATVNPLMGADAVAPFLDYSERLTFLLTLTSNPGADDFLLDRDLFLRIAERAAAWNTHDQVGLVVGATRPEQLRAIRAMTPRMPFLIPGVGAQDGDLAGAAAGARCQASDFPGFLIHVTRGILPPPEAHSDHLEAITKKIQLWQTRIQDAMNQPGPRGSTP